MSIAARASINSGADQSGKITIVDGDVVQPKLADYTGVGTILWEIISFPSGFSTPSGWTAASGRFYWQGSAATGYVPPSIDFTSAPWGLFWFRVTIDNGISGDDIDLDETRDETLAVEILGPSSMRDVPVTDNSLAIPGETFRLVWGAIQANLRLIAPVLLPAGTVEGQACRWNNTSGAWEAATGVVIGGSYIALGGNAPSTVGLNLSNGESIQGKDAGGTERLIIKLDPTTGDTILGRVGDVRVGTAYVGIGSDPAPDGSYTAIGLSNATWIVAKSSVGNDAYLLGIDGSDLMTVGEDTDVANAVIRAATAVTLRAASTDRLTVSASGIDAKGQTLTNIAAGSEITTNVTIGSGYVSTYQLKLNQFWGTAANGINMGDGAVIQQNDGGDVIRHIASIDTDGNLDLGPTTGDKIINAQGNALHDFRDARGNATSLPGSGSGVVYLKLDGDNASLTLSDIVDDNKVNTIRFRVRVEDSDGSDAWTDDFEFNLKRTAGNIRVTRNNSSNEGATALLGSQTGQDSTYTYQISLSDTADALTFGLTDDASIAREARVTSWWDTAEDLS